MRTTTLGIDKTYCHFHQHFTSSFCANIIFAKKLHSQTASRENLRKTLLYRETDHKMLTKLTPRKQEMRPMSQRIFWNHPNPPTCSRINSKTWFLSSCESGLSIFEVSFSFMIFVVVSVICIFIFVFFFLNLAVSVTKHEY